ncbi:helix-turn-helix transcriptional regulator [Paenibacillus sp. GYB004]|uniref:helix-turn-helix domain-containing protein n=1 Tax=Paenibacillus sp. GYB004 TaxID=2994393 RepID=UPI002F964E7B
MEIADKILNLMAERDITKYRLAKESKVPYTTLTKILDGTTKNPQIDSLQQIADYFGKPVDYFIDKEERPAPEWATAKDKRDFKKFLVDDADIMFDGVPMSEESKQRILGYVEAMFWDAKKQNKRKKKEK